MSEDYQLKFESIESDIRSGRSSDAKNKLNNLNTKKIPRAYVEKFANLSYRSNLPNVSLRILGNYIGDRAGLNTSLSGDEIAEYAISLSRLGANHEANRWLNSLETFNSPKTLLYKSFIHITQWEYDQALPYFEKYLGLKEITEYQALVAKTNMVACMIFIGKLEQAEQLLNELIQTNKEQNNELLLTNAYELMSQVKIGTKDYKQAKDFVEKGLSLCRNTESRAEIYLNKWDCVLTLRQNSDQDTIERLLNIKQLSLKKSIWENVRECDFYLSEFQQNNDLFHYVYFGTPHKSYREYLLKKRIKPIQLNNSIEFSLGSKESNDTEIFNIDTLNFNNSKKPIFKFSSLNNSLLKTLTADFYNPQRIGSIFSQIYPGEFYDPFTSPDRVHQAIRRFRKDLKKHNFDMKVEFESGGYLLKTGSTLKLKKSLSPIHENHDSYLLSKLKKEFGENHFSLKQAREHLKLSKTKVHYLLKPVVNNEIIQTGKGPATKYKFTG